MGSERCIRDSWGAACSSLPEEPREVPPVQVNVPQWEVLEGYEALESGQGSVRISLADQRLTLLDGGGQAVMVTDCSTGKAGKETPRGTFRVLEKIVDKSSNLYGSYVSKETGEVVAPRSWLVSQPPGSRYVGTPMPYWMRLTWTGVGIHVGNFERGTRTSMGLSLIHI